MPDLILLPGLNNTRAVFDGVLAALPTSITATALDNPALANVDDIAAALLPQLPQRFWLAGFSFGGYVALALLALAPERVQGIAMLCTAPFADTPAQSEKRALSIITARSGGYLDMIDSQAANAFHPDSIKNAALMGARRAMVLAYGAERFIAHTSATMLRPDRSHLLDGSLPTLVLGATHDNVFPAAAIDRYADAIPGVRRVVIDGAGHLAPMEKPREVAAALAAWVLGG